MNEKTEEPGEPEECYGKPREMTGFFSSLSNERQKKALEYRGPENFGSTALSSSGKTLLGSVTHL